MSGKVRRYSLWLEGEIDSTVTESPGDSPDTKYAMAYEAAQVRGCPCAITDETDAGEEQGGILIAMVRPNGEVTDGAGLHQFWVADRIESLRKSRVKVAVVCRNAEGSPDIHTCTPEVTEEQRRNGKHYDLARENAEENGYEGPFLAFDADDAAAKSLTNVAKWFQTT